MLIALQHVYKRSIYLLPIAALLSSCPLSLPAQITGTRLGLSTISLPEAYNYAPLPSDVLTPNTRRNTPYLKIGVRAGINLSSYSNDRYLDNVSLDVGQVSGESDIYTSAAGFGFQTGVDVEYPLNTGLSILLTGEYDRVRFSGRGPVKEPCVNQAGETLVGTSTHDFSATIDYLKLAGSAKFSFSSFYLTFGLTAEHPVSTSLKRTRRMTDPNCYFPDSGGRSTIDEDGEIPSPARLHYSLRTGLGLIYQLSNKIQFSPELTLDFGFTTINKSPNSDLGVYGISATLRYDL